MWVVVVGSKGEAANAIRRALATAEAEFVSYYVDEGVQCHYSALYSPQQNSVIER
jgi:hypothetical protein